MVKRSPLLRSLLILIVFISSTMMLNAQFKVQPAAALFDQYLHKLKGRKVALFANQTSVVGKSHLVDTLLKKGVNITVVFGPEHGFRGKAEAGADASGDTNTASGVPVVTLYGAKRKPTLADLHGADLLLFDIQDVGCRFYTYISSLQDFMEAAIELNKPLMVLDRPNPNARYIDGPVLEPRFKSFVGMQPVPVVYGMTIGEYAQMVLGEGWLSKKAMDAYTQNVLAATYAPGAIYFGLEVIKCGNYTHQSRYDLPVAPSPNLPDMGSVWWYPSTCFFEGTVVSEGRGTEKPFQIFGHPSLPKTLYAFVPQSRDYAKEFKPYEQTCYGWNLSGPADEVWKRTAGGIQLGWLLQAYKLFPNKDAFFYTAKKKGATPDDYFFNRLAGNATLMQQIKSGATEAHIRKSWEPGLNKFKAIRKKYLLYP